MRHIQKLIERMEDEVKSAKEYAENYVESKVKGNVTHAAKYKSMAEDELRHAMFFHEIAMKEIEEVSKLYTPPVEMQEHWEHEHKEYVERVAWVKQMLAM